MALRPSSPDPALRGFPRPPTRPQPGPTARWTLLVALILIAPLLDTAEASPPVVWPIDGLDVEAFDASIDVADMIVVTETQTTYRNVGSEAVETSIPLRLAPTAVLGRLAVEIDGQLLEGMVKEKQEAQQQYDDSKQQGRAAAILTTIREGEYALRVNVPAHESATLFLTVVDWVPFADGARRYTFPLAAWSQAEGEIDDVHIQVNVTAAEAWDDLTMTGVEMGREDLSDRAARFTFTAKDHVFKADLGLVMRPGGDPYAPTLVISGTNGTRAAIISLLPPPSSAASLPLDVVFVLDRSGSMSGDKIVQARDALVAVLDQLDADDRFALVRFSSEVDAWESLRSASPAMKEEARGWIRATEAQGGTDIDGGLLDALAIMDTAPAMDGDRLPVVVLITDGQPTVGVTDPRQILENVDAAEPEGVVRIHALGIGFDRDDAFLRTLTMGRRGLYEAIDPAGDVRSALGGFLDRITAPVLRDVEVTLDRTCAQMHPDPHPDLYAGVPVLVSCRIDADGLPADVEVRLTGIGTDGPITVRRNVTADAIIDRAETERLWARLAANDLVRRFQLVATDDDRARLERDIIAFGVEFQVATPFTSWVLSDDADPSGPVFSMEAADSGSRVPLQQQGAPNPAPTAPGHWSGSRLYSDGASNGTDDAPETDNGTTTSHDAPAVLLPAFLVVTASALVLARRRRSP